MPTATELFERRKRRNRYRVRQVGGERPRLSVFRSNNHIYAQVIDDRVGRTLASACSLEAEFRARGGGEPGCRARGENRQADRRALARGRGYAVVFDRGGYRYHGQVKALADAAREAGLAF